MDMRQFQPTDHHGQYALASTSNTYAASIPRTEAAQALLTEEQVAPGQESWPWLAWILLALILVGVGLAAGFSGKAAFSPNQPVCLLSQQSAGVAGGNDNNDDDRGNSACSCATTRALLAAANALTSAGGCIPIYPGTYATTLPLTASGCYALLGNYTYSGNTGFAIDLVNSNTELRLNGYAINIQKNRAAGVRAANVLSPRVTGPGTIGYTGGNFSDSTFSFGVQFMVTSGGQVSDVVFSKTHRGFDGFNNNYTTLLNVDFSGHKYNDPLQPQGRVPGLQFAIVCRGCNQFLLDGSTIRDIYDPASENATVNFQDVGRALVFTQTGMPAGTIAKVLTIRNLYTEGGTNLFRDYEGVTLENVVVYIRSPLYIYNCITADRVHSLQADNVQCINRNAFEVFDGVIVLGGSGQVWKNTVVHTNIKSQGAAFGQLEAAGFRIGYGSSNFAYFGNAIPASTKAHGITLLGGTIHGGDSNNATAQLQGTGILVDSGSDDVTIDGVNVNNAHGDLAPVIGLPYTFNASLIHVVAGASKVTIQHCKLTNSGSNGILIDGALTLPRVNNNLLFFSLPTASGVTVKDTSFHGITGCAINNKGTGGLFVNNQADSVTNGAGVCGNPSVVNLL